MKEEILEIYDDSSGELVTYRAIELISGAAGQYMGQEFAENYPKNHDFSLEYGGWSYFTAAHRILLEGRCDDEYYEAWINILETAFYIDPNDRSFWYLYHDENGNLWRVCRLSEFPQEDQHD